jgi:hypothetical protein
MEYAELTAEEAQGLAEAPTPALESACRLLNAQLFAITYGMGPHVLTETELRLVLRTRHHIRAELVKRRKLEDMKP